MSSYTRPTDKKNLDESTDKKLSLASQVPGLVVEMDPEEAELAGAFREEAISEEDARDAVFDEYPVAD